MNARRRDSKRKGFPPNLYCKPDGYFWYRNPENSKTKGLGRDKAEAFRQARLANAALAVAGELNLAAWVMGRDGKTLADWAIEYQEIYIKTRGAAENTIANLKTCIRAIVAAKFAKKPIDRVVTKDISEFIEEATESRGPRMSRQILTCIQDMYREAGTKGLVENNYNPATIVRKPSTEVQRDRLSLEQFYEVRKHAKGWLVDAMDLALITAQRREDLALAKFSDIRDGCWYCEQGKTGMKIRIHLTLRLAAADMTVGEVIKRCRNNVVSQYLIHHPKNTTLSKAGDPVWKDTISKGFAKALKKAAITWQEGKEAPTFHEIRSLAERLYEKEYGRPFAQKLLGHKSEKMTSVYADSRGSEWLDVGVG
jgi:integrase